MVSRSLLFCTAPHKHYHHKPNANSYNTKRNTETLTDRTLQRIFTALHGIGLQTRCSDKNISPPVRPSVKRVHCDKTEESCACIQGRRQVENSGVDRRRE